MIKKLTISLTIILIFLSTFAYGATFKGKVIDADTKEPIEGAVVVASWSEERATPTGPTSRLNDVKETLTDKNGEWQIKGPKGGEVGNIKAIFSFLTGMYFTNPPEFIVFKPGYCSLPKGFGIDSCKEMMRKSFVGIGQGQTVELPRLTKREDRLISLPGHIYSDSDGARGEEIIIKQKEFIKLMNEESKNLGISGY